MSLERDLVAFSFMLPQRRGVMKQPVMAILALTAAMASQAGAQSATLDPNPAMNNADMVAWQLFVQVNASAAAPGNNNALFETWASDSDTFRPNPVWPATPSRTVLSPPALLLVKPLPPGLQPRVVPGGGEEVRRNKPTFDFIVQNNLYTRAGLRQAFASGKPIIFPTDSIEVKANWAQVETVNSELYHVNTASDGKQYALVSMHIISKQVPNWTWATFEHQNNPGRCDYIGCNDSFGATVPNVAPEPTSKFGEVYPACQKTPAVLTMFQSANLDAVWQNYCLKGSQVDFTTPTGVPTLLGNTVPEAGFVNTSSCLTCHARAAFDILGRPTPNAGFLNQQQFPELCPVPNQSIDACSPNGTPLISWFWKNQESPNQQMRYMQSDFVWAVPFKAIGQ
jgi:hypothetical protein